MIVQGTATRFFLPPGHTDLGAPSPVCMGCGRARLRKTRNRGIYFFFATSRRLAQGAVLRRQWLVDLRQAFGTETFHLAGGGAEVGRKAGLCAEDLALLLGRLGTDESIPAKLLATRVNRTRIFIDFFVFKLDFPACCYAAFQQLNMTSTLDLNTLSEPLRAVF